MKKVLILTHSVPETDHPAKAIFIRDELQLLKMDVNLVVAVPNTISNSFNLSSIDLDIEIKAILLPYFSLPLKLFKKKKGLFIVKSLKKNFNLEDFNLVHSHFLNVSGLVTPYLDAPTVITIHGSDWNNFKNDRFWFPILENALKSSTAIIAVSSKLKEDIVSFIPEVEKKVFDVPHSVDPFWFELPISIKTDFEAIEIVAVASLIPQKGVLYLIKALKELDIGIKINLTVFSITSEASYKDQVLHEINKLPASIKVNLKGESKREQIREAYMKAHFSVLPSLTEGFGLSIIEANACGLPVIATKSGGPESIISDENGLLIPPADYHALASAIKQLIQSLDRIEAKKIRDFVKNKFSPESRKEALLRVYDFAEKNFK